MIDLDAFKPFIKKQDTPKSAHREVWCYTRVSSKDQESNFSLENQKKAAEKYCQNSNCILTHYFGGTYESGKQDFSRKEFMNLLSEIKRSRSKPFAILVYKMNRFSRSGGKSIAILNEIIDRFGVNIIEVVSGISTDSPKGRNELNRRLLQAEEENLNKLEQSVPGMISFLQSGQWLGRVPMGYDHLGPKTTDHSRWHPTQKIELNETGKLLREAWHMKAQGSPDYEILSFLHAQGIKMSSQKLSDFWRNPFYCGMITHKLLNGEMIPGKHEPMISPDIFLKVNGINKRRPKGYLVNKSPHERPLTGDLLCCKCGQKLTGYYVKRKGLHYYKCQKCSGISINAISRNQPQCRIGAHELFLDLLESYELHPDFVDAFESQMSQIFELANHSIITQQAAYKKRLTEKEKEKDQLQRRFALGKFDDGELYNRLLSEINSEIISLRENNGQPLFEISNRQNHQKKALHLVQNVSKYWINGDIEEKRSVQKLVFPNGFLIDPVKREYLTPEVNCLFKLSKGISRRSGGRKKRFPAENSEESDSVPGAVFLRLILNKVVHCVLR